MAEIVIDSKILDNPKVIEQTIYDSKTNRTSQKIILPEISDEELLGLYGKICPIFKSENLYWYLKRYELSKLRKTSYLRNGGTDKTNQFDMSHAETIAEFSCYHSYGYHRRFIPTIAEVLQQFPVEALQKANAFYMYEYPENVNVLNIEWDIGTIGCHKSKVRALYLKK
jgi:hypothetical protein